MTDEQPTPQAKLKALDTANRRLLRAMRGEERAARKYETATAELREAKRAVKLLIEALQPPLFPSGGIEREEKSQC
jgi:hypothetical protein